MKNSLKLVAAGLLVAALLVASTILAEAPAAPTLQTIGNEVQCLCGCNAPLNSCPHLDCAEKSQMLAFIKQEIAAGKDEASILQDMAQKFGLQVLSTPPAHGFNLSVWILPGLGVLIGLATAIVIARRWRRKPASVESKSSSPIDPKVLSAMEEEMKSSGLK